MSRVHTGHAPHNCQAQMCKANFALKVDLWQHMQEQHPTLPRPEQHDEEGCQEMPVEVARPVVDMVHATRRIHNGVWRGNDRLPQVRGVGSNADMMAQT